MKTTMLLYMVVLISGYADAQKLKDSEVPNGIRNAFNQKFAGAKEGKWSKEGKNEYEVAFEFGGNEQSASFDNTGKWIETEIEIKTSELPQAVQTAITKEFVGYKIEEAEKAESVDKGTFYEVELKKEKVKYEVQLSPGGTVIKKEEKKTEGG